MKYWYHYLYFWKVMTQSSTSLKQGLELGTCKMMTDLICQRVCPQSHFLSFVQKDIRYQLTIYKDSVFTPPVLKCYHQKICSIAGSYYKIILMTKSYARGSPKKVTSFSDLQVQSAPSILVIQWPHMYTKYFAARKSLCQLKSWIFQCAQYK